MICRIQQIVLFKKLKITKAQEIMMRLSPKLSNDSKNMLMIIGFMRSWRIFICIKKISKKQRKSFIMRENYTQSQAQGFIYKDIFSWKNEIFFDILGFHLIFSYITIVIVGIYYFFARETINLLDMIFSAVTM